MTSNVFVKWGKSQSCIKIVKSQTNTNEHKNPRDNSENVLCNEMLEPERIIVFLFQRDNFIIMNANLWMPGNHDLIYPTLSSQ